MKEHSLNNRTPSPYQRLYQLLLPILVAAAIASMGYYAASEHETSKLLAQVAQIQKHVVENQTEIIQDVKAIKQNQEDVRDALMLSSLQLKMDRIRIISVHHADGVKTCVGCHDRKDVGK